MLSTNQDYHLNKANQYLNKSPRKSLPKFAAWNFLQREGYKMKPWTDWPVYEMNAFTFTFFLFAFYTTDFFCLLIWNRFITDYKIMLTLFELKYYYNLFSNNKKVYEIFFTDKKVTSTVQVF